MSRMRRSAGDARRFAYSRLGRTGTISSMSTVSILDRRVTVETYGREPGVICTNTNGDCSTRGSIAIIVSDGAIVDKFVSMSLFSGSLPTISFGRLTRIGSRGVQQSGKQSILRGRKVTAITEDRIDSLFDLNFLNFDGFARNGRSFSSFSKSKIE
jgi:hypothetical protein